MAVLAQAGVLTNALFHLSDPQSFDKWVIREGGGVFYFGTMCERREAPRWGFERIGVRALRSTLFRHSFDAVMAIPEVKRPPEWVAVLDKHATSASGDLGFALLAGPWGDFEGYQPPFQRSEFEVTLNGLGAMTLPVPGLEPFINGVQLESGDLTLLIGYGKGFVAPEGKEETALYILAVLSTAAGIYRNVELADVIADRCVELFPKVDPGTQQRLLSVVLEASNAYREESAGLTWAAKRYERLAWSASKATDLKSIDGIMSILRDLRPAAIPHFAATGAVVRLRTPSLAKPFATSRTSKQ
jgi:hypothetical protein